jgi:hypothetical protein
MLLANRLLCARNAQRNYHLCMLNPSLMRSSLACVFSLAKQVLFDLSTFICSQFSNLRAVQVQLMFYLVNLCPPSP